jgi:hypothetical protein
MANYLWNDEDSAHRFHLASWRHVTMKKEYRGLCVWDLRELNLCLLGSWIRRYSADKEKIWKMLIDFKYRTDSPNILTCSNAGGGSNFWKGVIWTARVARMGYKWRVGDGSKIRS